MYRWNRPAIYPKKINTFMYLNVVNLGIVFLIIYICTLPMANKKWEQGFYGGHYDI